MSFTPDSLLVPGRIKARLARIKNMDPTPLLVSWTILMQEDNRNGVLAGQDKDGKPMYPVSYRPIQDKGQHINIRAKESARLRLGQHASRKRDLLFGGMGPAASGLHNNLTSSEYRRLTGPPLAPREQFSRVITNLRAGQPIKEADNRWIAFCFWDEVVSTKGFSFLTAHFEGEGYLPKRDLRGVRPEGKQRCRMALREWTLDMIRASGVWTMPVMGEAEKIQLLLETLGIEGIKTSELAYDALEKQMKDLDVTQGKLKQSTMEFTETLQLQAEKEYNLADLMQEQARRMRERADAQTAIRKAIEESIEPTANSTVEFSKFGRSMLDAEKAMTTLATGHGVMRLGGVLERLTMAIGGPAGLGFAITSVFNALEIMLPQFLKWINADNAKHAKEIADAVQKQADAADQLAQRPTKKEAERIADITEYITETEGVRGGGLRKSIARALSKDPMAMLTDKEKEEYQTLAGMADEPAVRRAKEEMKAMQQERILEESQRLAGGVAGDRQLRLRTMELAQIFPGEFAPGVAGALGRAEGGEKIGPIGVAAERDKAMQAERAAEKEIEQGKEKQHNEFVKRIREREAAAKKHADEWEKGNVLQEKVEREIAAKAAADEDARLLKEAADEDKARKEAKRARDKANREAAHARTPAGRLAAEHKQVEDFVEHAGLTQDGRPATEGFKQHIAHGAEENLAKGTAQTMAQAVWQAINKYNANLENEFARAMGAQGQQGAGMQEKVNAMQFHNQTPFPRGQ